MRRPLTDERDGTPAAPTSSIGVAAARRYARGEREITVRSGGEDPPNGKKSRRSAHARQRHHVDIEAARWLAARRSEGRLS